MDILFAASEVTPIIKTGGLADVIGALPRALMAKGHDVRVIIPAYRGLDKEACGASLVWEQDFAVGQVAVSGRIYKGHVPDSETPLYLVEFEPGLADEATYPLDEKIEQDRFLLYGLVVIEWLRTYEWQPQVVHGHDWMTGGLIDLIRRWSLPYKTVLTVHNSKYQGEIKSKWLDDLELGELAGGEAVLNQLALGLRAADVVTTVSKTYAKELTEDGFGFGLEELYRSLPRLVGIINGLDMERFSPQHNPYVEPGYTVRTAIKTKQQHKHLLQMRLGLPLKDKVPLYGMVSRASAQKGFYVLAETLESSPFLEHAQLVVLLGRGTVGVEEELERLAAKYTKNMRVIFDFDDQLAHHIYAASDFFLMPSLREPCGLAQLIAMRYGAIPIVHKTGGLADTVADIRSGDEGRGIVFSEFKAQGLGNALGRSFGLYGDKRRLEALLKRNMALDFSWDVAVGEYEDVYASLFG